MKDVPLGDIKIFSKEWNDIKEKLGDQKCYPSSIKNDVHDTQTLEIKFIEPGSDLLNIDNELLHQPITLKEVMENMEDYVLEEVEDEEERTTIS